MRSHVILLEYAFQSRKVVISVVEKSEEKSYEVTFTVEISFPFR